MTLNLIRVKPGKAYYYLLKLLIAIFFFLYVPMSLHAQEGNISISMKSVKRTEILNEIKKQVDMEFFYNVKEVDKYGPIDFTVKKKSLVDVMKELLKNTNLKFSIENGVVNILLLGQNTKSGSILGTMINIKGKISDAEGNSLPGVNVKDSKTGNTTISDNNGMYAIRAHRGSILTFSYVGAEPSKVSVNAYGTEDVIQNVQLNTSAQVLDVVSISTGYQDIIKKDVVGAISSVKIEDIKVGAITSIDQLLQGQIAGVAVMNQTGVIGSSPRVRVRGTSTLLGNQEPVWVVDGIIQQDRLPFDYSMINSSSSDGIRELIGSSVSFLNMEDIEDITVLKDASATAIYGVKAANGVIVIRTKKGKVGATRLNYVTNMTISAAPGYNDFNLMNSKDRIEASREIYERGLSFQRVPDNLSYEGYLAQLLNKEISTDLFNEKVAQLETMNTDWFGLLYRNPFTQNHSLSLSGGSSAITYYSSIGISNRKGNTIGNDQETYNLNLNLNAKISDDLRIGFRISGNLGTTKGFYQFNPFNYAFATSRAIPAFNEDGSLYFYKRGGEYDVFNILNERDYTGNSNSSYNVSPTLDIDYKIIKGLSFQSIFGLTYTQTDGESYAAAQSYYIGQNRRRFEYGAAIPGSPLYLSSELPAGGQLNRSGTNNISTTFRNTLNFKQAFRNDKDSFSLLGGMEVRSSKYSGINQSLFGYLPDRGKTFAQLPITYTTLNGQVLQNSLINTNTPAIIDRKSNFVSYFATTAYNYEGKYVLNATIRTDASNRFGQATNNRFLPIWSAGFKWNIIEESFFNNKLKWLNQFSLRTSYGFQGNVAENFGPDLVLQYPLNSISPITGEGLMTIQNLGYPDLRWEKTASYNLGLDLALFKNRVIASLDYYYKKTTDALSTIVIPLEYGVTTMPVNAGNIENKGYELFINITPLATKNLNWAINFNTARNFNNIIKSGNVNLTNWRTVTTGAVYNEGFPVSSFWAMKFNGLDAQTGYPTFDVGETSQESKGNVTFLMQHAGQIDPKFTGGFGTNLRYKNFSLNSSFILSLGAHKFLPPLYTNNNASAPYPSQNLPSALVNRWRNPGDEKITNIPSLPTANMPRVTFNGINDAMYDFYDLSTARVVNADFLRCRNLGLSYNLAQSVLKQVKIRSANIQASVSNLFYIASKELSGIDPEVTGNSLPIPRVYALTLNVGF